jgi:hypothetical protein
MSYIISKYDAILCNTQVSVIQFYNMWFCLEAEFWISVSSLHTQLFVLIIAIRKEILLGGMRPIFNYYPDEPQAVKWYPKLCVGEIWAQFYMSNLSFFANDHLYLTLFLTFPQTRNTLSRNFCCSRCLPVALSLLMPAAIHSTPTHKLKILGDLHHLLIHHLFWCLRKALFYLYIFHVYVVCLVSFSKWLRCLLVSRIYFCTCDRCITTQSLSQTNATPVPLECVHFCMKLWLICLHYVTSRCGILCSVWPLIWYLVHYVTSDAATWNYYWN